MVNQSFEVPGKVLQPNTRYVMKLHDLYQNRNVVQVYTDDEKQMLTQFIAINVRGWNRQTQPPSRSSKLSRAIPSRSVRGSILAAISDLEFVYPKEQALEIAKHAKEPVLTAETAVNLHDLGSVTITAQEPITGDFGTTATAQSTVTGPSEAGSRAAGSEEPTQIAQNETPEPELKTEPEVERAKPTEPAEPEVAEPAPPPSSEQTTETTPSETAELPSTAGELPLVGMIGMLCLGLGLGLKVLSARS